LVNLPITDGEVFAHLLFNEEPQQSPIEMTYGQYKSLRNISLAAVVISLSLALINTFYQEIKEHGSLKNSYKHFIEQVDKYPSRMWNTF